LSAVPSADMPNSLVLNMPSKNAVYATNVIIVCYQTRLFLRPAVRYFFLKWILWTFRSCSCNLTSFCCANQIKNACNSKYIKYLSCICGNGRGTFAASEFLLSLLSMVYLIYGYLMCIKAVLHIKAVLFW